MPSVPTAHTARCSLIYTYPDASNRFQNTFYVRDPSDALFADIPTYASMLATTAITHVMTTLCPQIALVATSVEDVRSVPFGGYDYALAVPSAGTSAYTCGLPSHCAFAVKKLTGTLGRSGRGRWFWPLFGAGQLSAPDTVVVGSANAIVTALTDFQAAVEGIIVGSEMGIVSYRTGGAPRVAGLFEQITSWAYTDLSLDSQRRRLIGK